MISPQASVKILWGVWSQLRNATHNYTAL